MSDAQMKPLWMSGTAADDHPMVLAVSKRIRAYRKKFDKIEKIEASTTGKVLTDEQKQLLASKIAVVSILQELGKLRESQIGIVLESNSHEAVGPKEREEPGEEFHVCKNSTSTETQTVLMAAEPLGRMNDSSDFDLPHAYKEMLPRDLLILLFTARQMDSRLQPDAARFQVMISDKDRVALQYLTVLVEGSCRYLPIDFNLSEIIDECEVHALKYLSRSNEEFIPGCSYNYIHDLVDGFVASTQAQSSPVVGH